MGSAGKIPTEEEPIQHKIGSRNRRAPYYDPPLDSVKPAVQKLLEEYGGIGTDDVLRKILEAREKLWEVYPWPCVGEFRFLEVKIHELPSYPRIVDAVRSGARYLDVGSCFGQDLRKLVSEPGVPRSNLFCVEKEAGFLDAAFDFFGDRNRPPAQFIAADVFDVGVPELQALVGTVDVAHLSFVLHIWDWDGQLRACERLIELLKPEKGVLVIGKLVGRLEELRWPAGNGTFMYKHSPESFRRLWDEVGNRTATKWNVQAYIDGPLGTHADTRPHYDDPPTRRVMFEVERL